MGEIYFTFGLILALSYLYAKEKKKTISLETKITYCIQLTS